MTTTSLSHVDSIRGRLNIICILMMPISAKPNVDSIFGYEGSSAALTSYAPKPSLCYAKRIVKSAHSITIVVVVATSYRLGFGICSGEKSLLIEVDPKPHPERVFSSGWDAKEI